MRLRAVVAGSALAIGLLGGCAAEPDLRRRGRAVGTGRAIPSPPGSAPAAATRWAPSPGATWQWQLTTPSMRKHLSLDAWRQPC